MKKTDFVKDVEFYIKKFVFKENLETIENNILELDNFKIILRNNFETLNGSEEYVYFDAFYDYLCFENEWLKFKAKSLFSFADFVVFYKSSHFKLKKFITKFPNKKYKDFFGDLNFKYVQYVYFYYSYELLNSVQDFFVLYGNLERSYTAFLKFNKEFKGWDSNDEAKFTCEFCQLLFDFLNPKMSENSIRLFVYYLIKLKKYVFKLIKLVGVDDRMFIDNHAMFMKLEEEFYVLHFNNIKKSEGMFKADEIRYINALPFNINMNRENEILKKRKKIKK